MIHLAAEVFHMISMRTRIFFHGWILTAVLCLECGGCAAPRNRAGITSSYPLDRVRAAVACADAGDPEAVDLLIGLLDDPDRGVRMYSIVALRRLCGTDYGYRYYAPDAQRAEAIDRWRQARIRGEVGLRSSPSRSATADSDVTQNTENKGVPTP